ncbi:MAG: cupin domain-containing protein [Pirellulales bacterium]|nr:cupin domain-containing protein [Pirellulales bacterium]
MQVHHYEQIPQKPVTMPGAQGCTVRWLVGVPEGAPNFSLRQFEVAPGGFTPRHFHDYEHEIFVLEGRGEVLDGETPHPLGPGDVLLVKPNEPHQFRNTGQAALKFLCLIPNSALDKQATVVPECGQ